jgi:hypothetical protein
MHPGHHRHVMHQHREGEKLDEHPRRLIQQPQQLAHGVAHTLPSTGIQPEVLPQFRRVGGGEARAVDDQDALPGLLSPPRSLAIALGRLLCAPYQRLQELPDHRQRQPGPGLTVRGGGERPARELPQVVDGGVAVQHLQQEQLQRHHRREQPLPPGDTTVAKHLKQQLTRQIFWQRRTHTPPHPREHQLSSHPWPPVG